MGTGERARVLVAAAAGLVAGGVARGLLAGTPGLLLGATIAGIVFLVQLERPVEVRALLPSPRAQAVYRAALEGCLLDGVITGEERASLEALRHDLRIGTRRAARVERLVRASI